VNLYRISPEDDYAGHKLASRRRIATHIVLASASFFCSLGRNVAFGRRSQGDTRDAAAAAQRQFSNPADSVTERTPRALAGDLVRSALVAHDR